MKWTAHNVRLGDEFAFGEPVVGAAELVAARLLQVVGDVLGPVDNLRVLDLACLEGLYGLEFAMHGADVLSIEGRDGNAEKVRLAAQALSPKRFEIRVEDVRALSAETHGTFDVVLCLGILYHLDGEDVLSLAKSVASTTTRMAIFRTTLGLSDDREVGSYRGSTYPEAKTNWSSIGNSASFWPTRASLLNLLCDVGFSTVMEIAAPPILEVDGADDGVFLVALKGEAPELHATPPDAAHRYRDGRWPENHRFTRHPTQRGWLGRRLRRRYWQRVMRRD